MKLLPLVALLAACGDPLSSYVGGGDAGTPEDAGQDPLPTCMVPVAPFTCAPCPASDLGGFAVTYPTPAECLASCADLLRRFSPEGNSCIRSACQGSMAECRSSGGSISSSSCIFPSYSAPCR